MFTAVWRTTFAVVCDILFTASGVVRSVDCTDAHISCICVFCLQQLISFYFELKISLVRVCVGFRFRRCIWNKILVIGRTTSRAIVCIYMFPWFNEQIKQNEIIFVFVRQFMIHKNALFNTTLKLCWTTLIQRTTKWRNVVPCVGVAWPYRSFYLHRSFFLYIYSLYYIKPYIFMFALAILLLCFSVQFVCDKIHSIWLEYEQQLLTFWLFLAMCVYRFCNESFLNIEVG